MKKRISRVLALVLAAVLAFSVSPALDVAAATKKLDKGVYYLHSKYDTSSFIISVDKAKKITNISSSAPKVAKATAYSLRTEKKLIDKQETTNSGSVSVVGYKPGKATIKFKAGNTNYTKAVEIKKYENPLSNLTVNGKDVTKSFNATAYGPSVKAAKKMTVNAKSKGNWVVTGITIYNSTSTSFVYNSANFNNNPKSASHSFTNFNTKGSGQLSVELKNKKDGGTITVSMSIMPSTSK